MSPSIPSISFCRRRAAPPLGTDAVHVWLVDLDARPIDTDGLSVKETERAKRFHYQQDATRYSTLHRTLRALLGGYLGTPGKQLTFVTGEHGKPSLATEHGRLHFNISRSARYGLIAVSRTGPVGIDIEHRNQTTDVLRVGRGFFAAAEVTTLEALDSIRRQNTFFDLWTRKEAYLKALGTGLSRDTRSFSVADCQISEYTRVGDKAEPQPVAAWTLTDIPLGPSFSAALVTTSKPPQRASCYTWNL